MLAIGYKPAFVRQYQKLPRALQEEVKEKIALFVRTPTLRALRVHKLKGGMRKCWSLSVNYQYRIVFSYEEKKKVVFLAVGDHVVYD